MTKEPTNNDVGAAPVSYSEAITEVESILAELEGTVIDVDHLADRVRRASELLAFCRERLAVVEVDVADLVDALEPGHGASDGQSGQTQ